MALDMNSRLLKAYESALDALSRTLPPTEGVSRPLLLVVPDSYHRAEIKLIVVGQQTHGWADGCPFAAADLMCHYREFDLAIHYGLSGTFWRAAHKLYRGLNPQGPERAFLWSNLVKVDQRKGRPVPDVEEVVSRLRLLSKEIAVTRPDAVVFFTGPNYEERLRKVFPGVDHQHVSPALSKLVHSELPSHAYQTCHPHHLSRSKQWHKIDEIVSLIVRRPHRDPQHGRSNNTGSIALMRQESPR